MSTTQNKTAISSDEIHDALVACKDRFFNNETRLDIANKHDKYYSQVVWKRIQSFVYTNRVVIDDLIPPSQLEVGDYYLTNSSFTSNSDFILVHKVIKIVEVEESEKFGRPAGRNVFTTSSNCQADSSALRFYADANTNLVARLSTKLPKYSTLPIYGITIERAKRKLFVLKLWLEEIIAEFDAKDQTTISADDKYCHTCKVENLKEEIDILEDYLASKYKVFKVYK